MIDLRLGDCLEIMPTLAAQSFDAIIADIPYGTTACKWDTVIPFASMWENLKRLAKPKAAIVLFGSQPFTSALVMSNAEMFKYQWCWIHNRAANFAQSPYMPLKNTEDIAVFSAGGCAKLSKIVMSYYPLGTVPFNKTMKQKTIGKYRHKGGLPRSATYQQKITGYPKQTIEVDKEAHTEHPTQKPVALMEYLIRTYTNEGDAVLDFTMGSGTTMVACVNTKRNGTGIEKDAGYYAIAERRIAEAQAQIAMPMVTA